MRLSERNTGPGARGPAGGDPARNAIAKLELDDILAQARAGAVEPALARLIRSLAAVRAATTPEIWTRVVGAARTHPLRGFLHLDPFTLRCYARPRGHCADGTALDYALRGRALDLPLADPVAALHQCIIRGQTARALRFRRDALARAIEEAIARSERPPAIFAAGSGHLREWDRIVGFGGRPVGRVIAFDTDPANLEQVRRDYANLPIATQAGSIRDLMRGGVAVADMDLVYCSSLMETLPDSAAAGLARALFGMVRRGGTLVVAHFLPGLAEAAFLETFMDWRMAYRTREELGTLLQDLLAESASGWQYHENPESTLGVIALQRR